NIKNTVLVKTGKTITAEGIKQADYLLASIAELPKLIKGLKS
ncbi:D,D-heptose 1,7-bisphosphate phosphatase, partial [Pasteurella multocida subsp. gallicida str. Anand1_poultry]